MFEELKIVELASVLAGPMVGSFFAELGAEVLKIENSTTGGDITRKWKLPNEPQGTSFSAYYAAANYGKKSLLLNLQTSDGYNQVIDFIKNADILIVNFKFGDAKKLGFDYETIKKINQQLIYAEITGFSNEDSRTAFDVVLQAETGFMSMNGERNSRPLKMPVALIDILAAHQLKEGILCSLIKKLNTNKGSKVSVSLYESAIASLANQATNYIMAGTIPAAIGSEHPNIAPYGDIFQTKDNKWITLAVGTDRQFHSLCATLGIDELASNEDFKSNANRVVNRERLIKKLNDIFSQLEIIDLELLLKKNNIPYGRIKNMEEVFQEKLARDLVIKDEIDGQKAKRVKTAVFRIS
jgi:crotonobetainyl-CoA:carnitine CoA-transferase CaiB-like acyl-CoA transferase